MPLTVNVTGGTNAGRRRLKQPKAWVCRCGTHRTGYSCPVCGARRPTRT